MQAARTSNPDAPERATEQYHYTQWLEAYGPLTAANVLVYFSFSPFYTPEANNEVLALQGLDAAHLVNMVGIEYVVRPTLAAAPGLFTIERRMRRSPTEAVVLNVYYCIGVRRHRRLACAQCPLSPHAP